ncbi:ESPN [Symbiodinium sp. CCMP2592]|nr:ESPN [Symbiodinium sp. CCMP2592]
MESSGSPKVAAQKTHPGRRSAGKAEDPAIVAARAGDVEALRGMNATAVLAATDHNGCGCFHWAAGNGHLHVLRLLAQWAAETASALEPLTWNQRTPFHYAARNGQLEVCRWLLESRCDAQRPARDEVSPLQLAVWQNHLTTSQWLVQEAGADALQRNRFGCSVAHWLSQAPVERAGQPQGAALIPLARWLKAEGCDFRAVQEHGHHCLHKAAWSGHAELCRWLREECGMRDDMQDKAGNFAADLAEMAGHASLATWLRDECGAARAASCLKLGLREDADLHTIRQAYLRLAREVHPDGRPGCCQSIEEFAALHAAYHHLTKLGGRGVQTNPRHQERLMLTWDGAVNHRMESERERFKARLLTVVGEFGDKGFPASSLKKKYAQVFAGAALPPPSAFGLRKSCGLLELLRTVASDVVHIELDANGKEPWLRATCGYNSRLADSAEK